MRVVKGIRIAYDDVLVTFDAYNVEENFMMTIDGQIEQTLK